MQPQPYIRLRNFQQQSNITSNVNMECQNCVFCGNFDEYNMLIYKKVTYSDKVSLEDLLKNLSISEMVAA